MEKRKKISDSTIQTELGILRNLITFKIIVCIDFRVVNVIEIFRCVCWGLLKDQESLNRLFDTN